MTVDSPISLDRVFVAVDNPVTNFTAASESQAVSRGFSRCYQHIWSEAGTIVLKNIPVSKSAASKKEKNSLCELKLPFTPAL